DAAVPLRGAPGRPGDSDHIVDHQHGWRPPRLRSLGFARDDMAGRVAFLALSSGLLILAHTISALLTLPAAGAIGLAGLLERPRAERRRGFGGLAAGLALGVALGALYWLPAFGQQASVHLDRARWTEVGGGFLGSFEWPWQLVQSSLVHDYAVG